MVDNKIKEILDGTSFSGEIKFNEPMPAHTSLRIGGPAEIMLFPEDPLSLKNALLAARGEDVSVTVIGAGTNLLVGDGGIEGITISLKALKNMGFTGETDEERAVLYAGAGAPLAGLLNFAQKNGYAGLEALAGIPGFFGGAVYMNAGSFGMEIKDVVVSVAVMNLKGELSILKKDELGFSYRSSNLSDDLIVLSANITLKKDSPEAIAGRMKEFLRRKKDTQPLGEPSAGCVFRNPEGDAAGRLIDAAGCKGMRTGDVEVSAVHANYFINKGGATCKDFIGLMEKVRTRVREHSGIILEPEIKIVGTI
ncbi:MAG: UDP-N-acetylmuramate dehydrogenase [Nitrospiraceae bacterium]|nr:MAG: UDP-N-acetylmuramate dehydrogenase [Nitrospiraceae bacterium]